MVSKGQGCDADPQRAMSWFEKAAEQGLPDAQIALGEIYRAGGVVEQSHERAKYWLEKALQAGHPAAAGKLAQLGS
jgi:uncharacterized protein